MLGEQLGRHQDDDARAAARGGPVADPDAVLGCQSSHHGEAEAGALQRGQVVHPPRHGLFGVAHGRVGHLQPAVLDGDDDSGGTFLHVDVDLVDGRREVGGVVHEFGQQVHDALGRVAGDRGVGGAVHADPLVGGDPADGAAQDALHHDGPVPGTAGAPAHQEGQPVGDEAELRGAVVQAQQVAEDLLAVPVLHLPQVGEHADGLGLDAAEGLGGGGLRGGGAPFAVGQFPHEQLGAGARRAPPGPVQFGQDDLRRGAVPQLLHRRGQGAVREVFQLGGARAGLPHGLLPPGLGVRGVPYGVLHQNGEALGDLSQVGAGGGSGVGDGLVRAGAVADLLRDARQGDVDQVHESGVLLGELGLEGADLGPPDRRRPAGPADQVGAEAHGHGDAQPGRDGEGRGPAPGRSRGRPPRRRWRPRRRPAARAAGRPGWSGRVSASGAGWGVQTLTFRGPSGP